MSSGIMWFMKIHWWSFMNSVTELGFLKREKYFVQFRGYRTVNNDYTPLRESLLTEIKQLCKYLDSSLLWLVGNKMVFLREVSITLGLGGGKGGPAFCI